MTIGAESQTSRPLRKHLDQILIEQDKISEQQLDECLSLQKERPQRIGDLLSELGHVDGPTIREALVIQARVPSVNLDEKAIEPESLAFISAELAFRHKVLPFETHNRTLSLAMADPFDRDALEAIRVLSQKRIRRFYCPEAPLMDAARRAYGSNVARMIADLDESTQQAGSEPNEQQLASQLQEMAREPTVVNLVNLIVYEAIDARASDIHVEPFEKTLKVKYRIDGVLHEREVPPKKLQPAIVSRIKILAGMNIAERFVPRPCSEWFSSSSSISSVCYRGRFDARLYLKTALGVPVVERSDPTDDSYLGHAEPLPQPPLDGAVSRQSLGLSETRQRSEVNSLTQAFTTASTIAWPCSAFAVQLLFC